MKSLLKRLLALNLAILILLTLILPASAADETDPVTSPAGSVYATIGGESCTLSDIAQTGSGWRAYTSHIQGYLCVNIELTGYHGSEMKISGPENLHVRLTYRGDNEIIANETGVTGVGIETCSQMQISGRGSLRITGAPAVDVFSGDLYLYNDGITLNGNGGAACRANALKTSSSMKLTYVYNEAGEITEVTCKRRDTRVVTLKDPTGAHADVTKEVKIGGFLDLTNIFTKEHAYVQTFRDEAGNTYMPRIRPQDDITLTAVWADANCQYPAVFYANGADGMETMVADGGKDVWSAPEMQDYTVYDEDGVAWHYAPVCWRNELDGSIHELTPGQQQTKLDAPVGYYGCYIEDQKGIIFYANGETFSDNGKKVLQVMDAVATRACSAQSGKTLLSWNTEPDGSGVKYAADGAAVEGAEQSFVRLYAQWQDLTEKPGTHTITVGGQTCTIDQGVQYNSSEWSAGCSLNGDNMPIVWIELYSYTGGPITVSDPQNIGSASCAGVVIHYKGECRIDGGTDPAITAKGYRYLTLEGESDASITLSGRPAVSTDEILSLRGPNITLDGGESSAFAAQELWNDDEKYTVSKEYVDDVLVRLTTAAAVTSDDIEIFAHSRGNKGILRIQAARGKTIEMPDAGTIEGQKLAYWEASITCKTTDNKSERQSIRVAPGGSLTIPENAVSAQIYAYWMPEDPTFEIDGQKYMITEKENRISAKDGTWDVKYVLYNGAYYVSLYGYQGGAIRLSAPALVNAYSGESTVTGAAGQPAISCLGTLQFETECSEYKHPTLAVRGGTGAAAVKADELLIDRAPHVELCAGDGKTIITGSTATTPVYTLQTEKNLYYGILPGAAEKTAVDPKNVPDALEALLIEPRMYTLTVNGNGGTSKNGNLVEKKTAEAYTMVSYAALGFTKPGCYCLGYSSVGAKRVDGNAYTVRVETDCEITLFWAETGLDSYLAFRADGVLTEADSLEHLAVTAQSSIVFVDYKDGVAAAPNLHFKDYASYGDLLYWYTEEGEMGETEESRQFLPGEQISAEADGIQSGMTLRAVSMGHAWAAYFANGKEFANGRKVVCYGGSRSGSYTAKDGSKLMSWNTKPDGSGESYAVSADVPKGSKLYAQWAAADSITINVISAAYDESIGNPQTKFAVRGGTITMPDAGTLPGRKLAYWAATFVCKTADGEEYRNSRVAPGGSAVIPKDAVSGSLHAYWSLEDPTFEIDGRKYTITEKTDSIGSEDGTWQVYYSSENGIFIVSLHGYRGGAIRMPAPAWVMTSSGENVITGAEGQPAISCLGTLQFETECSEDQHPSLVVRGGTGAAAIEADGLRADRAPHVELYAGDGKTIVTGRTVTTPIYTLQTVKSLYYGILPGTEEKISIDPKNVPDALEALLIAPRMCTLKINGNGGKSKSGNAVETMQAEAYTIVNYAALGFTKPGCYCLGYTKDGKLYESYDRIPVFNDSSVTLSWLETGFESYLAFCAYGELEATDSRIKLVTTTYQSIAFVNYQDNAVAAPDLRFKNYASYGDLLYWYLEDGNKETEKSRQFLPGEQISAEADGIQSGMTLRAVSMGNVWAAYFANGKEFENGKKVVLRYSSRSDSCVAKDGSKLMSWNTKPDGSGESYAAFSRVPEGTKLYAQWQEPGSIRVVYYNYALTDNHILTFDVDYDTLPSANKLVSANPGDKLELPTPETAPTGLKFAGWDCFYIDANGNSQTLPDDGIIPADADQVYANALWLPAEALIVNGRKCTFTLDTLFFEGEGWSAELYPRDGWIDLRLSGYTGGSITLPCATALFVSLTNTIDGTLTCNGRLQIYEQCADDTHGRLTITADDGELAIAMRSLIVDRAPHLTLIGGRSHGAVGSVDGSGWRGQYWHNQTLYYGQTSPTAEEAELIFGDKDAGRRPADMQIIRTKPVMCSLTLDGSGGTTADGALKTIELETGEDYNLRRAGFTRPDADLIGVMEDPGNETYEQSGEFNIRPRATQLTLHLKWKELGYPFIAFRANKAMVGDGIEKAATVIYKRNSSALTVPELRYQSPASPGDLIYWYTSDDGRETQSSRIYLPGEKISEPDGTTLYAADVWPGQIALVATGTKFADVNMNSRVVRASTCMFMQSIDGRNVTSWNTKPDGTGDSYSINTPVSRIDPSVRVLYAQWEEKYTTKITEADGEKTLTLTPKYATDKPNDTSPAGTPFEQAVSVILAAYQDGQFAGMVFAEAIDGVIRCKLPAWLDDQTCELRLFFLEGGKPTKQMEILVLR